MLSASDFVNMRVRAIVPRGMRDVMNATVAVWVKLILGALAILTASRSRVVSSNRLAIRNMKNVSIRVMATV